MEKDLSKLRWPTDIPAAKLEQEELRHRVEIADSIDLDSVKKVAGTDVAFKDDGKITRAVIVVMTFPEMEVIESVVEEQATYFPYIPGYLSYRELPALTKAYLKLSEKPELFLCDGQGIAHPRRFGLAAHLGVLWNVPAIGVAKNLYVGEEVDPGQEKGSAAALFHKSEQLGWILRSRTKVKPIYVSPGHKISLKTALKVVESCCVKYRLPEPTRIADKISKIKT